MTFDRTALVLILCALVAACQKMPKSYAMACSTPLAGWGREKDGIGHLRAVQPIYIASDGSVLWNRNPISDATLRKYMAVIDGMNPQPQAILEVAPTAPCDRVQTVRAVMDASPLCKGPHSLCSEGWNWKQWPEMGGP